MKKIKVVLSYTVCGLLLIDIACIVASNYYIGLLMLSITTIVAIILAAMFSIEKSVKSITCSVCGATSQGSFCPMCGSRLIRRPYDKIDISLYDVEENFEDTDEYPEEREYEDTEEDIRRIRQAFIDKPNVDEEF